MSDSHITLNRSAKGFFFGTFLSRISGLLRDIALAFYFGSGSDIAAFMVAFRFANLFRRLLGDSSIQAGFIPHFESIRVKQPEEALKFYRDLFFSLLIVLMAVVAIMEIFLLYFV